MIAGMGRLPNAVCLDGPGQVSMNFVMETLSGMPFSEIPPSSGATRPTRLSNKSLNAGDHSGFVTGNLVRKDPSSSYRWRSSLHVLSSRANSRGQGGRASLEIHQELEIHQDCQTHHPCARASLLRALLT